MPEAPATTIAIATSEHGDESTSSEGSSIEPGEKPGEHISITIASAPIVSRIDATGSRVRSDGAMLLSQLRRR